MALQQQQQSHIKKQKPYKVKAPVSTEPIVQRLHISGLSKNVKAQDLVDRFNSFGKVIDGIQGVQGFGVDANGDRKDYAFINLATTSTQLNKCISLLSGSMWKGQKLRIAPARPDYKQRFEAERSAEQAAKAQAEALAADPASAKKKPTKKRKRSTDPNVGYEATHFELVNADNIDRHRGWTLDTPSTSAQSTAASSSAPSPLFPLILRPSHPIFPPAKPERTSWTRETPKARQAREERIRKAIERPVIRAKRIRIDPRKWGRQRIVFDPEQTSDIWGSSLDGGRGWWECEEDDDEGLEVEDHQPKKLVRWVYKAADGSVRRRETLSLGMGQMQHTDRFTALLEGLNRPGASSSKGPTKEEPVYEDHFGDLGHGQESGSKEDAEDNEVQVDEDGEPVRRRPKSLSPPPYIPTAPRSLLYNEEDTFALLSTTRAESDLLEDRRREKEAQLKVLQALLDASSAAPNGESKEDTQEAEEAQVALEDQRKLPAVEGFADESDEEDWGDVLRLRGGAKDDDDSDSDDDSSDEDEDSSVTVAGDDSAADNNEATANGKEKTSLERGVLKEMFKPKEGQASFSLMEGLDLEMDELERTPSPPPISAVASSSRQARNTFVPPPALGRTNRAWVGVGPVTPFFAFPGGVFEKGASGEINQEEVEKCGITMERALEAKAESDRWLKEQGGDFWRSETMEETEKKHQELRDKLRGVARKRHREALKTLSKKTKKAVPEIL